MTQACHIIHLVWSSESLLCLLLICVFNTDKKKKNFHPSTQYFAVDHTETIQEFRFLRWIPVAIVGSIVLRPLSSVEALPASFFSHLTSTVTDACNACSFFILHSIHFLTCWIKHKKCCFKHLFLSFSLSFLLSFFLSSTYQESPIYMAPRSEK